MDEHTILVRHAAYERYVRFAVRSHAPATCLAVGSRREVGVGWVDVNLLASAVVAGLRIWTAEPRLLTLADGLHVAYAPIAS
jgi:hypothetical protein